MEMQNRSDIKAINTSYLASILSFLINETLLKFYRDLRELSWNGFGYLNEVLKIYSI